MASSNACMLLAVLTVAMAVTGAYGFLLHQCEGTPMRLSCTGRANKIWIYKATWGMTDRGKCGGPVLTTNCKTDVTNMVNSFCWRKSTCFVIASNAGFGDPCPGTRKYLEVHYACQM